MSFLMHILDKNVFEKFGHMKTGFYIIVKTKYIDVKI